nr:hypothetical protein [Bacteroidaceae bacterium]
RCRCTDYKDPDGHLLDSKRDEYLRLLHEGAEAGSSEMMQRLGYQLTLEYNEEDTTDERRAELETEIHKWWERASQLGSGDATQDIAFAYFNGQYGYERNNLEAWKHYNKSAMQGNNDAYYYLATLAYLAWDESIADEEREFRLPPDASPLTASEWDTLGHIIYEANDMTWPDDEN